MVTPEYVTRFWARVASTPDVGCWIWTGRPDGYGYGRATIGPRRVVLAHRAAYEIAHGPLPDDVCVLHHCDNPPCVRPDHLFRGDRGDNARDMAAKGRQHVQRHPEAQPVCPPELKARGERNGRARFTDEQVLDIRRRVAAGESRTAIARDYEAGLSVIGHIASGKSRKEVGGPLTHRPGRGRRSARA